VVLADEVGDATSLFMLLLLLLLLLPLLPLLEVDDEEEEEDFLDVVRLYGPLAALGLLRICSGR